VDKINVSLSIFFVILCAVMPLIVLILMWKNFIHLESVESRKKYGELYEKLDLR
jgi:high-affinity nickel permease